MGVEHIRHGHREEIIQVRMARPKNVLDGAEHAQRVIRFGNHGTVLHIGSHNEGNAAVRIHMVAAVLCIVFDDKDQCVILVGAVGDGLHDQAHGVVVIRFIQLRRINSR